MKPMNIEQSVMDTEKDPIIATFYAPVSESPGLKSLPTGPAAPVGAGRVAFESWFSDGGRSPKAIERSGEGYRLMQAQSAWIAFKAGTASETALRQFAEDFLNPERYGYVVTAEIRNHARRALGMPTQEPEK